MNLLTVDSTALQNINLARGYSEYASFPSPPFDLTPMKLSANPNPLSLLPKSRYEGIPLDASDSGGKMKF